MPCRTFQRLSTEPQVLAEQIQQEERRFLRQLLIGSVKSRRPRRTRTSSSMASSWWRRPRCIANHLLPLQHQSQNQQLCRWIYISTLKSRRCLPIVCFGATKEQQTNPAGGDQVAAAGALRGGANMIPICRKSWARTST